MKTKFEKWFNEFMNGDSVKMSRAVSKQFIASILDEYCDSDDYKVVFKNKSGIVEIVAITKGTIMTNDKSQDCVIITLEE